MIKIIQNYFAPVLSGKKPERGIYLILVVGFVAIFLLPLIFSLETILPSFRTTGEIGDTINGIAGPFIAIVAAILTFLAFFAQINANNIQIKALEHQNEQFAQQITLQRETQNINQFESKFYVMLNLHRLNVEEMNINNKVTGRKVFVSMFSELRFVYYHTLALIQSYPNDKNPERDFGFNPEDEETITLISYLIFFYGVGPNSNALVAKILKYHTENQFLTALINHFENIAFQKSNSMYNYCTSVVIDERDYPIQLSLKYKAFQGHLHRLGHYYRHLFQTVKLITSNTENLVNNGKDYLRTLRAQLSNHEQLLLFYNSISPLGYPWIKNEYFTKFKMIKNIPLPLADFGITPINKIGENDVNGNANFEKHHI